MSEPVIRDTTPQSSAILAYGESSRGFRFSSIATLVVVFIVVTALSLASWMLFGKNVPVPDQPTFIIALPSSEALSDQAPLVWREAKRRSGSFPILVGIARSIDGSEKPFAITLRLFSYPRSHLSSLWQLISDDDFNVTSTRLFSLSHTPAALPWMRLWPSRLDPAGAFALPPNESINGRLLPHRWETSQLAPQGAKDIGVFSGKNIIDLQTLPTAWSFTRSLLLNNGYDVQADPMPSVIEWGIGEKNDFFASLIYTSPLSDENRVSLAASAGIYDRTVTALDDGTITSELQSPTETVGKSTSTSWTSEDGRSVTFSNNMAVFGVSQDLETRVNIPEACRGPLLAGFDRSGLGRFFSNIGLKSLSLLNHVYWIEQKKRLIICWD